MKLITYSPRWSGALKEDLKVRLPDFYETTFVGLDADVVWETVTHFTIEDLNNACYVPSRGDSYTCNYIYSSKNNRSNLELVSRISRESLISLLRHLCEKDHDKDDRYWDIVTDICYTCNIEFI